MTDSSDNFICPLCWQEQSRTFRACIYCCDHAELDLTEDCLDDGMRVLDVVCGKCGKDFDFSRDELISKYKLVLR